MEVKKVGIVGLGVVGTGTLEILIKEKESIAKKVGVTVEVAKACDLNIDRDFGFDFDKSILTNDFNDIINDDEISVVVELIGGYTVAKNVIERALKAGKSVVTANKALVAKYAKELFALAKENNAKLYYEASVGGGIPIITPLQESLIGNNIECIKGIINGTANYILTEMTEKGLDFSEVLKKAQELGYAEADPTFDIEGIDTAHKITILASLAYGGYIDFEKVAVKGITKITKEDITYAQNFGYAIKLLAVAKKDGEEIEMSVEPTLIKKSEMLANVNDVFNAVEVDGDYVGKTLFYGKGAGMQPTGSAVVADVIKLATESKDQVQGTYYYNIDNDIKLKDIAEIEARYYIRLKVKDKVGILANVSDKFKANNLSIESMVQTSREKDGNSYVSLIFITHETKFKNLKKSLEMISENKEISSDDTVYLKIAD